MTNFYDRIQTSPACHFVTLQDDEKATKYRGAGHAIVRTIEGKVVGILYSWSQTDPKILERNLRDFMVQDGKYFSGELSCGDLCDPSPVDADMAVEFFQIKRVAKA